jgi:hypothetical protein
MMVGAPLNALACLVLLIAAWMPDWAERKRRLEASLL